VNATDHQNVAWKECPTRITASTAVPAILDLWHNRGIVPIIAEPLAKLAASGRLEADDPALAAQHLSALTFGQVNNASMMGTVQLSDAEADRIIATGIAAFLRAYGPPAC
jgi:TetR/AcrR family transcriptional regulator, mexJK operon transcriptional repressor